MMENCETKQEMFKLYQILSNTKKDANPGTITKSVTFKNAFAAKIAVKRVK
jgi:hypothetical protein